MLCGVMFCGDIQGLPLCGAPLASLLRESGSWGFRVGFSGERERFTASVDFDMFGEW